VQSIMPMAAGAPLYAVHPRLAGAGRSPWRFAAVVPLIPMADGLVNAGVVLPIWSTLGSHLSLAANYAGAVLTIGMAATGVWVLTVVLGAPHRTLSPAPTPARSPSC
jgi:hypothetical protein